MLVEKNKLPYKNVYFWTTIITSLLFILTFLFGQGILIKPKIVIHSGAIKNNFPYEYTSSIMFYQMLQNSENMNKKIKTDLANRLAFAGFDSKIIKKILNEDSSLELSDFEESKVNAIISTVTRQFKNFIKINIPESVLYFKIINTGLKSAKNVRITFSLTGDIYNSRIESIDKIELESRKNNKIIITCNRLSPNSEISGYIWASSISSASQTSDKCIIELSHDNGSNIKEVNINQFYYE